MYATFLELVQNISMRPGMYLFPLRYEAFVHYLLGYEHGADTPILEGFNLWLNIRLGWDAKQYVWSSLALDMIFGMDAFDYTSASKEKHAEAIRKVAELITEFLNHKEKLGIEGIKAEYRDYESENRELFEKRAHNHLLNVWGITDKELSKLRLTVHNGGKSDE